MIKYFWDYFDPKRLKDEAHAAEAQGPLGSFFGYVAEEVGIWRWSSVRLPQTAKTSLLNRDFFKRQLSYPCEAGNARLLLML